MSDTSTQGAEPGETRDDGDPEIKQLRENARRTDEATDLALQLRRENAILRSGIDLESAWGEYFVSNYSGDPTDIEALKAEAQRLGVPFKGQIALEGEAVDEAEDIVEVYEPTGTAQRRALSDAAPADTGEDMDPRQVAEETFHRNMAAGMAEDDAMAESLRVLASAAIAGDQRVIYNPRSAR